MSSHSLKPHLSLSFSLHTGIISHTYVNICWSMITLHHFQILGQKVSKYMSTHGNGFVSADIGWLEWFKIYIWTLPFLIKFPFLNDILNRKYLVELTVGLQSTFYLFLYTRIVCLLWTALMSSDTTQNFFSTDFRGVDLIFNRHWQRAQTNGL